MTPQATTTREVGSKSNARTTSETLFVRQTGNGFAIFGVHGTRVSEVFGTIVEALACAESMLVAASRETRRDARPRG